MTHGGSLDLKSISSVHVLVAYGLPRTTSLGNDVNRETTNCPKKACEGELNHVMALEFFFEMPQNRFDFGNFSVLKLVTCFFCKMPNLQVVLSHDRSLENALISHFPTDISLSK